MAKKKQIIQAKEQVTECGIIIPGHSDIKSLMGNEALIEIAQPYKDIVEATVREHSKEVYIVCDKLTGREIRTYVKGENCEDPKALAEQYARKLNNV